MMTQNLFQIALNIMKPLYVKDVRFSRENRKLDITIDFKRGTFFSYKDKDGRVIENLKAYDVYYEAVSS